jgi:hypothetical protein
MGLREAFRAATASADLVVSYLTGVCEVSGARMSGGRAGPGGRWLAALLLLLLSLGMLLHTASAQPV